RSVGGVDRQQGWRRRAIAKQRRLWWRGRGCGRQRQWWVLRRPAELDRVRRADQRHFVDEHQAVPALPLDVPQETEGGCRRQQRRRSYRAADRKRSRAGGKVRVEEGGSGEIRQIVLCRV